jgi:transcriptional regulator with XRE-family HTH domain
VNAPVSRCAHQALVWKTVLSGQTPSDGAATDLGAQVRALRRERGLTLKALGQRAGLSHPFLSQVERGLAWPSVGSVQRIAHALEVPVAQLWSPPRRPDAVQIVRRGEGRTVEAHGGLLRELAAEPGAPVVREWTAGNPRWPAHAQEQVGELLIYVARGAVEVDLDGTVHALDEGDALRFDGTIPHRLRRRGGPGTRALIVATA